MLLLDDLTLTALPLADAPGWALTIRNLTPTDAQRLARYSKTRLRHAVTTAAALEALQTSLGFGLVPHDAAPLYAGEPALVGRVLPSGAVLWYLVEVKPA